MNCCRNALLVSGMLAAVPAQAQWLSRTVDGIMGTRIYVEIWAEDPVKGEAAIDAVMDEMRHIDDSMSTYKPTSEVSKVNALAAKLCGICRRARARRASLRPSTTRRKRGSSSSTTSHAAIWARLPPGSRR